MSKFTTFFYRNLDGAAESLVLPTVQSINLPDTSSIPSKPTIAGEYRNQYVAKSPIRATLIIWLEGEKYNDESLDVSESLDKLFMLKNNRIRFNITTSHSEEESRFLSDMVIESIALNRDSAKRYRLIATVNCTQVKFVNLTWKMASAVEIFGKEIFTSTDNTIEKMDFVVGNVDEDFLGRANDQSDWGKTLSDIWDSALSVQYESGLRTAPVSWQVKKAIENKVQLKSGDLYFKLAQPIQMSRGTKTYNCNCAFESAYGTYGNEKPYTVDIGQFVVNVTQNPGVPKPNFPKALFVTSPLNSAANAVVNSYASVAAYKTVNDYRSKYSTFPYVYEFADTYKDKFSVANTFDKIESPDALSKYLRESAPITEDVNACPNKVVIKDDYVWTYKISERYDTSIDYNNDVHKFDPDGGLKIDCYTVNTSLNGFKPKLSNEAHQNDFDTLVGGSTNYSMSIVPISLGTQLQIYLFASPIFNDEVMTNVNTSTGSTGVSSGGTNNA